VNYGKGIHTILSTDPTLLTLVDGNVNNKIFPVTIPQAAEFPAVVYTTISNNPSETKSSTSTLDVLRIQIDTYANRYTDLVDIESRVRVLLDGFRGTADNINIDGIKYLTSQELYNEELELHHRATDYQLRISRSGQTIDGNITGVVAETWTAQLFENVSTTDIEVTVATIPGSSFLTDLEVYRGGALLYYDVAGTDDFGFTIDQGNNKIVPNLAPMGENFIIKIKL